MTEFKRPSDVTLRELSSDALVEIIKLLEETVAVREETVELQKRTIKILNDRLKALAHGPAMSFPPLKFEPGVN